MIFHVEVERNKEKTKQGKIIPDLIYKDIKETL